MTRLRGRVRLSGTHIEGYIYAIYGTGPGEMYRIKWDDVESVDPILYDAHQLEPVALQGRRDAAVVRTEARDVMEAKREIEAMRTLHGPDFHAKRAPGYCTKK